MSELDDSPRTVTLVPDLEITLPARAENVAVVRHAVGGLGDVLELDDQTLSDIKLAVTEACTNSVRHGYSSGEGTVEIVYELQPDRLVVEVADDGPGFDAAGDRPSDENLAEGGLGIAIIRAVSDEFEAGDRAAGRGSRLRFVKLLKN